MKTLKIKILLIVFILGIAAVFCGCSARRVQEQKPGDGLEPGRSYSPELGTPATEADSIAKEVEKVPGIKGAIAVVSGDAAYIGINLDIDSKSDNTSIIQDIKKQAADRARNADSRIKTVYISGDADFLQRINQISNDVRNGKPIEGFDNELNELVKRITPEKQ